MNNQFLKAALDYATRGWPVFPVWWADNGRCACGKTNCESPAKHPIGKLAPNGRNSATTDPVVIKRWWTTFPQANIGITTGTESGLVVVDLDPRNGSEASLKRLEREHGSLPVDTINTRTGGGGEHCYIAHPGHEVKSASGIAGYDGIDVKGDGGYVLAPPSNHISGQSYYWKNSPEHLLAPCPDWFLQLLSRTPKQETHGAGDGEPIPEKKRNVTLTSLAGSMRRRGMGQDAIKAALLVENQRYNPPLPETEVRRIAQSVSRYEPSLAPANTPANPDKSFLPVTPPFPVEVFPLDCQRAITEIQRAHGVPLEIPGCALLGTAGGCIGRTRGICIKQGYVEHPNLWLAIVAPSGYGKSPVMREIQRSIFKLEEKWFGDYQEALKQYNLEIEQRRLTRRDERASLPPPPIPPEWRQFIVDDTTTEALTDAFAANPRGILWNRDELAGLLYDLDKYAKKEGGTKARMMSAYDSGLWKVNRKEPSKRALIPHATLSILGTIQPKTLPTIFSDLDAATGFLPRFIFVSGTRDTPPLWSDESVSASTRQYLAATFERLLSLNFNEKGEPVIIGVEREAKRLYQSWFNEQALEPWQNVEAEIYEAVLAKLHGQCLRIALILHCLEAADTRGADTFLVRPETMEKAITLANFFKTHQQNAWQSIINQEKVAELTPLQKQVVRAILSLESEIVGGMLATAKITERVNQNLDPRFHISTDSVGKAAASLNLTTDKLPDRTARGVKFDEHDLHRLKELFAHQTRVPSVLSVHKADSADALGDKGSVPEVSQASSLEKSKAGHLGHMPGTCDKPKRMLESTTSDTLDTSDTSFKRKNNLQKARFASSFPLIAWDRRRQIRVAITLNAVSIPTPDALRKLEI